MIRDTTLGIFFTGFDLPGILNIHCIRKTIMCFPKFGVLIPPLGLVLRFPSCKWTLSWAELLVFGAKCRFRQRQLLALWIALAPRTLTLRLIFVGSGLGPGRHLLSALVKVVEESD